MEYLIKTYTNEGDTVLDNCMGSGTTGVACVNTRRNFIGMEREFKYFRIARQRIKEAGGEFWTQTLSTPYNGAYFKTPTLERIRYDG